MREPLRVCHSVWHPNFDLHTGKVRHPLCENDWRPVLSMNTVIFGLQLLFLEPNPEYPANPAATAAYCTNREMFNHQVHQLLRGGWFLDMDFPCHLELRTPSKRRSSSFDAPDEELGAMCLESEQLELDGWSPARVKRRRSSVPMSAPAALGALSMPGLIISHNS